MVKENTMKQTEIGLIPEDWDCLKFTNVTNLITCGIAATPDYVPFYKGKPFLSSTNVKKGKIDYDNIKYIPNSLHNQLYKNNPPSKGDILYTRVGAVIGEAAVVTSDLEFSIYVSLTLIKVDKKYLINYYLMHLLNSLPYQNLAYNTVLLGGGVGNLNVNVVRDFPIICPPLPEQEAIAEVLSDADAWIESMEQLIAKKRLIKQGAMQELLTPKEDWEEKTIFEVADKKRDLFNDGDWIEAVHIKEEGIRLIQTGNIGLGRFLNKNNKKYISEKSFVELKCKEIVEGDLLICRLAEPAGRVCIFPKTEDLKSVTSVDVTIYRPDENIFDRRILLYLLSTDEWFKQVLEQVGGTTHKRISRGNLGNIKIKIPKSLTEQTRIATILSDMDAELEALEGQLGKARKVKQGMMQELLTGRVRLV